MSVNSKMTAIADEIRDKTQKTEPLTLDQMAESIPEVYEAGKKAESDRFWDSYLNSSQSILCFAGNGWTHENFHPPKDIILGNGYGAFMYNELGGDLTALLEKLGVKLVTKYAYNLQNMFLNARFTRIPEIDIRAATVQGNTSSTFNTSSLITIDKLITDESKSYSTAIFTGATKLENITFEGIIGSSINFQWCPLTRESITNIIEHLSPTTTGQTLTLKKTAKEAAFTNDEWDALIATKSNWVITLI